MAKPTLVQPRRSLNPSKMHVPTIDSPCFCGAKDAFLEDPLRDELYCRSCGFRLSRQTILHGPGSMHEAFVRFRAEVLEAGLKVSDPMNQLPARYRG